MTVLEQILGRWYVERVQNAQGDREGVKAALRAALTDPAVEAEARAKLHQLREVTKNDKTEEKPSAPEMRCFISRIQQELLEEILDGV